MTYAAITGWGKCMPPAVLSNADLATLRRHHRRMDHAAHRHPRAARVARVRGSNLSHVAASRALACAGLQGSDIDLIVYGSCSNDEQIPNTASGLSLQLGAGNAAAMDINTACTSFLYGLSTATAMIRTGVVKSALVVGVEVISPFLDWRNRNVAVLFGDGAAAVVLQASDEPSGVLAEKLGCYADAREILRVRGTGFMYAMHGDVTFGDTVWDFDGQEIFKRAVARHERGVGRGAGASAARSAADIDLVVPHQANLRIIEFVAKRAGVPMDRVFVTVHKYGNMSAATVPVALVEALEEGRVQPDNLLLTPAFGGGLTYCSHVIRWGERVTPLDAKRCPAAAVRALGARHGARLHEPARPHGRSAAGLAAPVAH